jgi:hypothetical protein
MRIYHLFMILLASGTVAVGHALASEQNDVAALEEQLHKLQELRLDAERALLASAMGKALRLLRDPVYWPDIDDLPQPLSLNNLVKVIYSEMELPVTKDQGRTLILGNRDSPSIATWVGTHGDRAARAELKAARGALAIERHWVPAGYHVVEEYAARRMYISAVSEAAQIMEVLSPADPGVRHVFSLLLKYEGGNMSGEEDIVDVITVLISVLGKKDWPRSVQVGRGNSVAPVSAHDSAVAGDGAGFGGHLVDELFCLSAVRVVHPEVSPQFAPAGFWVPAR